MTAGRHWSLTTRRGDGIAVVAISEPGVDPTILVTLDDVDGCPLPTAEFTIAEAAQLREAIRSICEQLVRDDPRLWR